jgi:hypothetical protein
VPISERMKAMLLAGADRKKRLSSHPRFRSLGISRRLSKLLSCSRKEDGWVRNGVRYSASHICDTLHDGEEAQTLVVRRSMGHSDLKPMELYQHQESKPFAEGDQSTQSRKKFCQVFEKRMKQAIRNLYLADH